MISQVFVICGSSINSIQLSEMYLYKFGTVDDENSMNKLAMELIMFLLQYCRSVEEIAFKLCVSFEPNWIAKDILFNGFASQIQPLYGIGAIGVQTPDMSA